MSEGESSPVVAQLSQLQVQRLSVAERLAKARDHFAGALERAEKFPELAIKHYKQVAQLLVATQDTDGGDEPKQKRAILDEMRTLRATAESNLSDILINSKRFDEAELYLLRTVAGYEELSHADSPLYDAGKHRKALKDLGFVQYSKGKLVDGVVAQGRCFRSAVRTFKTLLNLIADTDSSPLPIPNHVDEAASKIARDEDKKKADLHDTLSALQNIAAIQYNAQQYASAMETFAKIITLQEASGLPADAAKKSLKLANKRNLSHVRIAAARRIQCCIRCCAARRRTKQLRFRQTVATTVTAAGLALCQFACSLLGIGASGGARTVAPPTEVYIMVDTMGIAQRNKKLLADAKCSTLSDVLLLGPSDFAAIGINQIDAENIHRYAQDPDEWAEDRIRRRRPTRSSGSCCGSNTGSEQGSPAGSLRGLTPNSKSLTPPSRGLSPITRGVLPLHYADLMGGAKTPDSMSLSVGRSPGAPSGGVLGADWRDSPQGLSLSTQNTLPPIGARPRKDSAKMFKLEPAED